MSVFKAWLDSELPQDLVPGGGDVMVLSGSFQAVAEIRRLQISAGDVSVDALIHSVAPPGEVVGANWWSAIVPVQATADPRELEVAIHARLANGAESSAVLGRTRVDPSRERENPQPKDRLVAICMATFDPDPDLFRAQIESIRSQDHAEWLCVVSDDASPGRAVTEIERVLDGDERFTLIQNESRAGFYRNFERALRAAPAEAAFIALADQDDHWYPDKVSTLVSALGDALLAHSDARVVDASGCELAPTFWPYGRPGSDRLEDIIFANSVTGASCLFRSEVLGQALPFPALPGKPFHDRWLALVASAMGSIQLVDRPLYDYVQHPGSTFGHARAAGIGRHSRAHRLASAKSGRPNWRGAHDEVLARSVAEAIVLRLRLGPSLEPSARGALEAIERLPSSPASTVRVAARHAARAPFRRPGLEGAMLRGVAWRSIARRRGRRTRESAGMTTRGGAPRANLHKRRARIGITVTDRNPSAAFGDLHTATELAGALGELGHEVELLEVAGERWLESVGSVDVFISLHDRLDLSEVPDRVVTAAWIRNWTDRWVGRPWFRTYDTVFASSRASADLIAERSGIEAGLLPLATNPERFMPLRAAPEFRADLMFAGNNWGGERMVAEVLPRVAESFDVKIYGKGWEDVPGMGRLTAGPLSYEKVPIAYSSSALVVDDSSPHTRWFGAVNSRVFDALACGVPVASNDEAGTREIFGERFLVWRDADSLEALAREAKDDPARLRALAADLRAEVLAAHTYAHRARQLSSTLALA